MSQGVDLKNHRIVSKKVVSWVYSKANCGAMDDMCEKEMPVDPNLTLNRSERSFQFDVESGPPNKRAKNAIGKALYKTRPCFQFRAGSCPFAENCEFAHSMEELRELPHSHKEEPMRLSEQPREVSQIPVVGLNEVKHRPSPRQLCKGFLSAAGCQNGEKCLLIHNEHYMERQSAAICLLPGSGSGFKSSGSTSNWKARLCTKWDLTGMCVYGKNCTFAHGFEGIILYHSQSLVNAIHILL